ncbi:MAG: bifunctional DNA-binding transcriptional regulator/O6-methylguanine-DNA methyltransferase Ada [Myxococcales bacterium]|nr:bifunctional DNA-binding transcriptional regulator/O6-methylguanine-DNA methyltransferase Ada [Myxococcales bacterium]
MKSTPDLLDDAARWEAVLARQTDADGVFVYAVATTGVYCHPSCPSRRPRRENVAFFASGGAAISAGYRPCQRCRPELPPPALRRAALVAEWCRLLEDTPPASLSTLASHAGLSPHHVHKTFLAATGLTPQAWARARRRERLTDGLLSGASVTASWVEAGYSSAGRFYDGDGASLGMTPRSASRGGDGVTLQVACRPCSLGLALVAASDRGVCAILLGDDPAVLDADLRRRFPKAIRRDADAAFDALVDAAVAVVDEPRLAATLPVDIRGTVFQARVWQALRAIPLGQTTTYGALAEAIGARTAVRAVAGACANNPIAVAVPCHRVIGRDGALTGYRWGLGRKAALLAREKG